MGFILSLTRALSISVLLLTAASIGATSRTSVVLYILNGKNGKPIGHEHVLVFYGATSEDVHAEKAHTDLRTDVHGMAVLFLGDLSASQIQVFVDGHILCQEKPNITSYSIEQIEPTGLSTQNNCGSFLRKNRSNQFVVYARAATLREKMQR